MKDVKNVIVFGALAAFVNLAFNCKRTLGS